MSHLSKIKTSISNTKILQKTLDDYGFTYECNTPIDDSMEPIYKKDVTVKQDGKDIFIFKWNGSKYLLLADLEIWDLNIPCERLLEQITQQYSYNSIIEESIKYGFTRTSKEILQDGSLKLTLNRWNST
uniref:Uncharacterized protein ycf35 n=1 Tax=Caulacanthus okamurae TaxID=152008 RepID=A0A6H1U6T3_9FLOR|nr:conserved hypothetical plastid protein [Caulacanthus okamurae]QIZ74592.1 conserved hypothetical plastid protein [Caulacanthus okamurae]